MRARRPPYLHLKGAPDGAPGDEGGHARMIHGMQHGMMNGRRGAPFAVRLVFGLGVMLVGLLLTLDNFGLLQARQFIRWWPALLIAAGGAKLLFASHPRARSGGGLMVSAGTLLLLVNVGVIPSRLA